MPLPDAAPYMSLHRHVASPSYGTRFAARHEPRYPITLIACDTVALDRTSFHFRLGWIGDPFGHLARTPESRRSEAAGVTGFRQQYPDTRWSRLAPEFRESRRAA